MLWTTARDLSQKPSDLIGIEDTYTAFEFDAAVTALGRYVDNKLEQRDKNLKPVYKNLDAVLALQKKEKVSKKKVKAGLGPPTFRRKKKKRTP